MRAAIMSSTCVGALFEANFRTSRSEPASLTWAPMRVPSTDLYPGRQGDQGNILARCAPQALKSGAFRRYPTLAADTILVAGNNAPAR